MRNKIMAAVAGALMIPTGASAAVSLGGTITVPNDPATGATGVTVALTNVSASDALQFTVSGTPYLQTGNTYGVNAAGVLTVPASTGGAGVGGAQTDQTSGFTFGSLIATLTTGGFSRTVQVFATTAANGLGSSAPPTSLSYDGTLASLFSYMGAPSVSGTLNFRVDDSGYGDNSGSFTISQSATGAVPEPATWGMMLLGFGAVGALSRSRRHSINFATS